MGTLLFRHSVVSSSLWPHGLQHSRLPCPSSSPGSLLKPMFIESMMPFNHLILCCPLLFSPSVFPRIRVFSNESVLCIRWPNYWSFSISPSSEYSGLISFRIDWLDLLAVQGILKSLLRHHSSKASLLSNERLHNLCHKIYVCHQSCFWQGMIFFFFSFCLPGGGECESGTAQWVVCVGIAPEVTACWL